MDYGFQNHWKEKRVIYLFETANSANQESQKPKMEAKDSLMSDEKLKEASNSPESADKMRKELVALAEDKGEKQTETAQNTIDPKLSVLRDSENPNSERLDNVAKNRPELILGMAESLKGNPDGPKILDIAFQNAAKNNPGAALVFMHLCPAEKRDSYVKIAIKSAFSNHDPRLAAGYAYMLGDKDRKAVMSLVKKADPDGYRRYSAAA